MITTFRAAALTLLYVCAAGGVWGQTVLIEGSLVRQHSVGPGGKVSGTIMVHNAGTEKSPVRVYQTDYQFDAEQSSYGTPGQLPRSNANWITYTPHIFTIGPGERTEIQYQVTVPDDPKLAGSYWSMIMVEPEMPAAPPPRAEEGKMVMAIRTVCRYGIQVATTVPGTGAADLAFVRSTVLQADGQRRLQVDMRNTGEVLLRPAVWADVYDAQTGELVTKIEAERGTVYPTCTLRRELDLKPLAPGDYQVLVVADNGDDNVFGARYSLQVK